VAWSSTLLRGLSLGATRVHYRNYPAGGPDLGDYLIFFQPLRKEKLATDETPTGDDDASQMISLFLRWAFPESGLALYLEWARNDHAWDWRDLLLQPDHSRAYMVGLQKLYGDPRDGHLLGLEVTQLAGATTFMVRAEPTYYAHHIVKQGYTHLGQVIGSAIGPGSEAQSLEYHRLVDDHYWGVRLDRIRWFNDAHFRSVGPSRDRKWRIADTSYRLSFETTLYTAGWLLVPQLSWTYRFNRDFVEEGDDRNLGLRLLLRRHRP
jgi:hypothetical protein